MFGSKLVTRPKIFSTLRSPICGNAGKAEWDDDERSPGSRYVLSRVVSVSHGLSIDLTDQGLTEPHIRCRLHRPGVGRGPTISALKFEQGAIAVVFC